MSKDEFMDEELIGMVSYTDETAPAEMPCMEQDRHEAECKHEYREGPGEAKDASRHPIRDQKTGLQERLLGCMRWIGICGGISMLLWWFQVNDLMAIQAAYPCIVACGILGGFGVGKNAMK